MTVTEDEWVYVDLIGPPRVLFAGYELYVFSAPSKVHLTAQRTSCARNCVLLYMTKEHQTDRKVVRMNDNRIYKNVNLFPQD